jgi:hypothetical protein
MLEIFFLIWFSRHLRRIATAKGRSGKWSLLGVGLWFGGEVLGFIIGGFSDAGAGGYLLALLLAGVGATVAHFVVKALHPAHEDMLFPTVTGPEAPFAPQPPDLTNPYARPRAG